MYSKWLSLWPLFSVDPNVVWLNTVLRRFSATQKRRVDSAPLLNMDPNVVWLNTVLRRFSATQKRRVDSAPLLNIPQFMGIFA